MPNSSRINAGNNAENNAGNNAGNNAEKMTVVGGGLVGSLLAAVLSDMGFDVDVFEGRADMRKDTVVGGRSINLALSVRGIHALKELGIDEEVMTKAIAMKGRVIHPISGPTVFQRYGKDDSECIYSISRGELNKILMTAAEKTKRVTFRFQERLIAADLKTNELTFQHDVTKKQSVFSPAKVFGTDGSASVLRHTFQEKLGYENSQSDLSHGYKELNMPPGALGRFQMEKHGLHIWPRGTYMVIALPNCDGSFTCTLFLSHKGPLSFESLTTPEKVQNFFNEQFPDVRDLIPDLAEQFFSNPTGRMVTVKCSPWNMGDKVLLLGDAAHAIVPFFGQGMNCGFEDVSYLRQLITSRGCSEKDVDWSALFADVSKNRKPNSDAIADLAVENFVEMRDKVGDPKFLLSKDVEKLLEKEFPGEYISRYRLVTFSRIAYSVAAKAGRLQDDILAELCRDITAPAQIDLARAKTLIQKDLAPLLRGASIGV
jgi:kynurenine 3-monooxygenase